MQAFDARRWTDRSRAMPAILRSSALGAAVAAVLKRPVQTIAAPPASSSANPKIIPERNFIVPPASTGCYALARPGAGAFMRC